MNADADLNAALLEERLAALEGARSWHPRVVSRLESRIRSGDDLELFRVNPKAYAAETSMDEAEAIDLFFHAAHVGLFQMEWVLVCESCGNVASSFRTLEKVDPHFICQLCQMENDATADDYIQVTFTTSPTIRHIAYHDPASLSAEELLFTYQFSRDVRASSETVASLRTLRASTHYIGYLEAGETMSTAFDFDGAVLAVRDLLHVASVVYGALASGNGDEPAQADGPDPGLGSPRVDVNLTLHDGRFSDRDRALEPLEFSFDVGPPVRLLFPAAAELPGGPLQVSVSNEMADRSAVWIVEYPIIPERHEALEFEPILSAKEALSSQTFRDLFRSQTVAASEGLAIKDVTFLFTDLRDSTAMYEQIGDASAYNLVRLHFDALELVIREHGGAIVKTIGDAIMATFVAPDSGVAAALGMADRLKQFNRASATDLGLKMGLHRGHAIAVTSNDVVDYFGQTVNIAARVQALATAGQICLSEDVYLADGVSGLLEGMSVEPEPGIMKGVSETIPIYRVTLS